MKKFLAYVFATLMITMVSVTSMVFAADGYSFLNQNTSNAPELPGSPGSSLVVSKDAGQATINNIIAKISGIINWVLGLLALASLIIIIIAGIKILINSGDDKAIDAGYKTIKNVFVALLFIGASWLIVKTIFWIISLFVG